jgi:hypothetical protein
MNFKLKTIVAACAMAFAGQALALAPTTTPDVTLFISGSSAAQTMIGQVTKGLFVNGTTAANRTDVMWDTTSGKNYRGYFGVGAATLPATLAGKKILVLETALGGSIQGVNPVATKSTVGALDKSSCPATASTTVDAATGIAIYVCPGVQNIVPDAGISDVEPFDLEAPINLGSATALSTAQLASLKVKGVLGAVMGISVTSNAPASLTSLSKAQVAGLMGGNIADWSQIDSTATGKSIIVCRRVAGSGTQATINASFFGAPCMSSPLIPSTFASTTSVLGSSVAVSAGNVVVVENSSSGNVKTCLQYAKDGTPAGQAINVKNGNLVAAGSADSVVLPAGNYGIGVLGLDAGTTAHYTFAAINGSAASVANAASGAYDVWVETTFNDRGDLTGAKADLFTAFATAAGDPAVLGAGGSAGAPIPGVAALSENGWAASTPFDPANPVMRAGNFGNTCQPFSTLQ